MADLTAQRTLVKSPPELWSELSEVESLAKHLGELGEIRITKVEPETTVAWEGEQISGTVELEQSGWGTRVTFRATVPEPDSPPESTAPPAAQSEPVLETTDEQREPEPEPLVSEAKPERVGFIARWLFRQRRPGRTPVAVEAEMQAPTGGTELAPTQEPVPLEPVAVEPEPAPVALESSEAERVQAVLDGTLEALGQAHHRPFSRG